MYPIGCKRQTKQKELTMSAVHVKNHLLTLIQNANTPQDLTEVCATMIIPILEHTEGFWIELNYCYKAAELATLCVDILNRFLFLDENLHYKTKNKIEEVQSQLRCLADRYRSLQLQTVRSEASQHCNAG